MRTLLVTVILMALAGSLAAAGEGKGVWINGEKLSAKTLKGLEDAFEVKIPDGDYWYDAVSGAWGTMGGPTLGFTLAGIEVGGELAEDASDGDTGVFVNGRELHARDVQALSRCTPVYPGRYWVDAQGIGGYEGGPPLFNLVALCAHLNRPRNKSKLLNYGTVIAGDGIIGFVDSEGRSFSSGN